METAHKTRAGVVGVFWALGGLAVVGQMASLQLVHGDEATKRAINQQERRRPVPARRGRVVDRNGSALAMSYPSPTFALDPLRVRQSNRQTIIANAATVSGKSVAQINKWIDSRRGLLTIATTADDSTAARIRSWEHRAVIEQIEDRRHYPLGSLAGQLLGYVRADHTGGAGLEHRYDETLKGEDGWLLTLVDAFGEPVPQTVQSRSEPVDGSSLHLTLDATVQAIVEEELFATALWHESLSATAVMLNATTGAVMAMANYPAFDPVQYRSAPTGLSRNRAATDPYEPGSTFKVVAVAAAINEGFVTADSLIAVADGQIEVAGAIIHDDHHIDGPIPVSEVMAHSSNVGVIEIARKLASGDQYRYVRLFGFGAESGIDLPGESKGIVRPPPKWSGRSWATIAIGQEIAVTPIQLAAAFGSLANDGVLMQPYLVDRVVDRNGVVGRVRRPVTVRRAVTSATARVMTDMLCGVVDHGTGTGASIEGVRVAGKTGTAQIASKSGRGYEPGAYVASFVGYLPDVEEKLVLLVAVTHPSKGDYYASTVAAPTFKRIISRVLQHQGVTVSDSSTAVASTMVTVPDLSGLSSDAAARTLEQVGLTTRTAGSGDVVYAQSPPIGSRLRTGCVVTVLTYQIGSDNRAIPKVVGMAVRPAIAVLNAAGLSAHIAGHGIVHRQSPSAGRSIASNTQVALICRPRG